jgi:hypothetical protein
MIRSPSSTYSLFNILEILLLEGRTSCSKKNEDGAHYLFGTWCWYLLF